MDAKEPSFRSTLAEELALLVSSQELGESFVQADYVESKQDLLGEFLDRYTEELLQYKPFATQFSPSEMEHLRRFLRMADDAFRTKLSWDTIRAEAEGLLVRLRE